MIEWQGRRVLVDCGLIQGSRELAEENGAPFGFDAKDVDCALLTHAHLDHCRRLPLLVRRGFRGEIIATDATRRLTRLVLADAAHLQEEEARQQLRHARRKAEARASPLYTVVDVFSAFDRFSRTAAYETPLQIAPGLSATYFDAGHMLGSGSVLLEAENGGDIRSTLFSGDIGNSGRPLLRPPKRTLS